MNNQNNITNMSSKNSQKNGNVNMKKKPKNNSPKKNVKKVIVSKPQKTNNNVKKVIVSQKPQKTNKNVKVSKDISLQPKKNENQLTPKQTEQLQKVNNEQPIKMKSKTQANKDFMSALKDSNIQQFKKFFVFDDINETRLSNNQKPITIQRYSSIIKSLQKIFLDNKIMITDKDTIDKLLVSNFDKIVNNMKNLSYNSQRNKLNDIIMLLDIKDNLTDKDRKLYTAYRRKLAVENKMNDNDNNIK